MDLLGYSREELIGHTSAELNLIPPDSRERSMLDINERDELCDLEIDIRTKSGKIITVLASTETIMLNGQKHLMCLFDIQADLQLLGLTGQLGDGLTIPHDRADTVHGIGRESYKLAGTQQRPGRKKRSRRVERGKVRTQDGTLAG